MRFPFLGGSLLAGSGVIQALLGFGSNLVLVRHLSPSDFGSYAMALAIVSTTFAILSLRLAPIVIRDPGLDQAPELKRMYIGAGVVETFFAASAAAAVIAALGAMTGLVGLLILVTAGTHLLGTLRAFYERRMPLAQLALVETGASFASHAVAVMMVVASAGLAALYVRDLIFLLSTVAGLRIVGGLQAPFPRMPSRAEWVLLLRQGRDLWVDGMLEGLLQRLTVLLAGWFGGSRDAGFFFQAQRLAIVPHQILFPLVARTAMLWLSRLGEGRARTAGRNRLLLASSVLLGAAAVAAILFADPVVPWLFGETWQPVALLLVWLSGVVMFSTLFEILKTFCLATSQTSVLLLGRVAQYAVGALALGPWLMTGSLSMLVLAGAVSISFATAFAVMLHLLVRSERSKLASA